MTLSEILQGLKVGRFSRGEILESEGEIKFEITRDGRLIIRVSDLFTGTGHLTTAGELSPDHVILH